MSNFNSADIAAFKDVWVFCEQREGKLMPTDFELISKGRDLANELGVNLCGLLLGGEGIESAAKELGGYGADKVIVCESPLLSVYNTDAYAKVICDVIEEMKPEAFLIGATNIGRDLGPRCAAPGVVLGRHGLLKGRTATCFPGFEKEFQDGCYTHQGVVTDGNLTTARGLGFAVDLGLTLVELLLGSEAAEDTRRRIQYT